MFKKTAFLSLFIFLPAFFVFLLINRVKISQLEKDKFQITNPEAKMTTVLAASDEKTDLQIKSRESTLTLELPLAKSSVVKENNSLVVKNPASLIEYRYKPIPNGIKEEIILSQPPETNRFEVKMILEKLKMEKNGDGLPIFFDQNRNYRFHFQKPFAFDKNNQKTESLSYQIKTIKKNQEYEITLEIDKNWLNSSERAYPVIIDPTIIFDPQNAKPEVLEKRNAQTKTFSLGSGKFMATSYLDQVHFKNQNGAWEEIETNLNPITENGFSFANTSNNFQIFFKKNSGDILLKYQAGDNLGFQTKPIGNSNLGPVLEVTASVSENSITYPNLYSNVDLKYTIKENNLLEEYLFTNSATALKADELKQEIIYQGAEPVLQPNGSIHFINKNNGQIAWIFPTPLMYEANNPENRSFGLNFEIKKENNQYFISKKITKEGKDWLADPQRNYPVAIDASSGPNSPGTTADDSGIGTQPWSTTDNAKTSNNSYTTANLGNTDIGNPYSHYLKVTNFGFSITGSMDGIIVEAERFGSNAVTYDNSLKIVKRGSISGDNKATVEAWSQSDPNSYVSYGSSADKWGLTWQQEDINNSGFGFALAAKNNSFKTSSTASIDHIRITVYYTEPTPTDTPTPTPTPTPTNTPTPTPAPKLVFRGVNLRGSQQYSSGPNSPGTMADDATVGTLEWVPPDNSKTSDDSYSSSTRISTGTSITHYLKATNFGFNLPSGATINGIKVEFERKSSVNDSTNYVLDSDVNIIKSDGTIGTTDKSSVTKWSTSEAYFTYGGSSDLWDETWTANDINDQDFGVVLSAAVTAISGGGYGDPCLSPETKIMTPGGEKMIKDLVSGDEVLTYNHDKKRLEYKKINRVWSSPILDNGYYRIYYNNGENITATGNHKFFVNGHYLEVEKLKPGDKMLSKDLKEVVIEKIEEIQNIEDLVWDLTVENNQNFFANGILVHNTTAYVDHIRITVYYTN